MRVQFALWAGLVLLLIGTTAGAFLLSQGAVNAATVDTQRHYRAEVTLANVNTANLVQTAQSQGWWVRIQTNTDVSYFNGEEPCTACVPAMESAYFEAPSLSVDGENLLVRLENENWKLSLRPRVSMLPNAYELFVSPILPKTELNADDLQAIDAALAPLSLLTTPVSALTLTEYIPSAKPTPPEGARIDSVLYGITKAPDWKSYATQNNIELSGLRVVVLIELESEEIEFPESLDIVIESQSTNFVRAQVLIHDLVEVSSLEGVTFVRLPSAPQPPGAL